MSTVPPLCKIVIKTLSEANKRLQKSESDKSSGHLPKLQSFWYCHSAAALQGNTVRGKKKKEFNIKKTVTLEDIRLLKPHICIKYCNTFLHKTTVECGFCPPPLALKVHRKVSFDG